jgi:preprotein translocase subunit SecG
MALNSILAAGLVTNAIAILFLVSAIVLILVILIQKGKGGGLSSAFAGGMASGILGSKTGDVLTWITIGMASFFILVAIVLNKWWKPSISPGAPGQTPAPVTSTDTGQGGQAPAGQQEPTGQSQPQTPGQ